MSTVLSVWLERRARRLLSQPAASSGELPLRSVDVSRWLVDEALRESRDLDGRRGLWRRYRRLSNAVRDLRVDVRGGVRVRDGGASAARMDGFCRLALSDREPAVWAALTREIAAVGSPSQRATLPYNHRRLPDDVASMLADDSDPSVRAALVHRSAVAQRFGYWDRDRP